MRIFIDTNVLIYWVDDSARADTVEKLLAGESVISVQVLNEFANVLRKKRMMALADIKFLCDALIGTCEVYDLSVRTHQTAIALMAKYSLSLYDANIIAAAGLSGCDVVYSEDMQDGLNIKMPGSEGIAGPPQDSLHPLGGPAARQGWGRSERAGTLSIRNPFRT